jgi:flap endonuclease-1
MIVLTTVQGIHRFSPVYSGCLNRANVPLVDAMFEVWTVRQFKLSPRHDGGREIQTTRGPTPGMGNADLRELAVLEETPFESLSGSVVAVDAHNWLYRYLTTTVKWTNDAVYTTAGGTEVANLVGVVQGLPKFFEHDLTPVFVFDGAVTDLKADEVERRREQREQYEADLEEARERGDAIAVARLESRTQRLTDIIVETTRELLSLLDVPVVDAPAEGEAQCAHMARREVVDYAGTEDYDALLFGAPLTLRQLTSKGDPELMDLEATLSKHDLTWEQLVDAAILCGTDFNEGITGIGPKTAVSLLGEHGDLWGVLNARDEHIEGADRIRELFLDPAVTDVDVDTDVGPDVAAAREYVVETWDVDPEEVARGFERIEASMVQTGLEDWT